MEEMGRSVREVSVSVTEEDKGEGDSVETIAGSEFRWSRPGERLRWSRTHRPDEDMGIETLINEIVQLLRYNDESSDRDTR